MEYAIIIFILTLLAGRVYFNEKDFERRYKNTDNNISNIGRKLEHIELKEKIREESDKIKSIEGDKYTIGKSPKFYTSGFTYFLYKKNEDKYIYNSDKLEDIEAFIHGYEKKCSKNTK